MRPSTYVHALFYGYCYYNQSTIRIDVITKETSSQYGTNIKAQFVVPISKILSLQ
jgi:hypothetical protein